MTGLVLVNSGSHATMAHPASSADSSSTASGTTTRNGSADTALTELYMANYRSLVRLATLLLGDQASAEEMVQDAFVAMHGSWDRLRERDKALAYLRRTVVNRSRSALRHRVVVAAHPEQPPPDEPSAEHSALAAAERAQIMAALRGLPRRQRETLVLRYYSDLSEAQIAETLGISKGAVKSHASRGLAALRHVVEHRS